MRHRCTYIYWSVNRYPAVQNGSKLSVQHLTAAVASEVLVTLDDAKKHVLIQLLD
jgi:hypothetical protein